MFYRVDKTEYLWKRTQTIICTANYCYDSETSDQQRGETSSYVLHIFSANNETSAAIVKVHNVSLLNDALSVFSICQGEHPKIRVE